MGKRIYVASSWRNNWQPSVVQALRECGHEVYDFKNPSKDWAGFHWSAIQEGWENWTFDEYVAALEHPLAMTGFGADIDAMEWADTFVLVLPCGRSAHLELGWAVGKGKKTIILHDRDQQMEPELMSKMVDAQFDNMHDVVEWLK